MLIGCRLITKAIYSLLGTDMIYTFKEVYWLGELVSGIDSLLRIEIDMVGVACSYRNLPGIC